MKTLTFLLTISLVLASCGKKDEPSLEGEPHRDAIEKNLSFFELGKKLYPIDVTSDFKKLNECALSKDGLGCTPQSTPLLSMKNEELNNQFILKHTLVSHPFLAKNFIEFLQETDNKYLRKLFGSVSGIVITDQISSSFYYNLNGMIYLSAKYLWKTQKEFSQLKFKKDGRFSRDPRKKVGNDLDFVKNNELVYDLARKKERTIEDLSPNLLRLLFHELSHASDVYPEVSFSELDMDKSYGELRAARKENKKFVSQNIYYPETYGTWEYAQFYIYGDLVNPDSYVYSREDFIQEFAPNTGMVFYSYATNREHLAMMMEAYLMLFTEKWESCNTAFSRDGEGEFEGFFWFQKNRILQDNILSESKKVLDLMLEPTISNELTDLQTDFKLETISSEYSQLKEHCNSN